MPIDDINPDINVAANFGIADADWASNKFIYGVVPEELPVSPRFPDGNPSGQPALTGGDNRAPINIGGSIRNFAVSPSDWLDLTGPSSTDDLTPTFSWDFVGVDDEDIQEVSLFVSTFPENEGLFPWDEVVNLSDADILPDLSEEEKRALLTRSWNGLDDFNPNRILTATWKKDTNAWYWYDGEELIAQTDGNQENNSTHFTLPDELTLTVGQDYNVGVYGITTTGESVTEVGQVHTLTPESDSPFSSVTVLTHGFRPPYVASEEIPTNFYELGNNIISVNGYSSSEMGLMMQYDKPSGMWQPVNQYGQVLTEVTGGLATTDDNYLSTLATNIEQQYVNQNKPLVLLSEWVTKGESSVSISGFSEGAADAIFASLVGLDQALGGEIGISNGAGELIQLYDEEGDLIRTQGAVFNSPLHFIGFSRGAVVNSEMIQHLGTYYPYAGGPIDEDGDPILGADNKPVRDLQMTTIDPHDFKQESLKIDLLFPGTTLFDFRDFNEPEVNVWENVTFADNYYQELADPDGQTLTPNGRIIDGADFNFNLEGLPGFTQDNVLNPKDSPHGRAFTWYSGTLDLALNETKNAYTDELQQVDDQLGDKDAGEIFNWFKSGANSSVGFNDVVDFWTPWYKSGGSHSSGEGIGNGWSYSILGGGVRPDVDLSGRTPVSEDNTDPDVTGGDFAVPTVFNGNFDYGISNTPGAEISGGTPIPGWSFHNGDGTQPLLYKYLVDVDDITTIVEPELIDETGLDGQTEENNTAFLSAALSGFSVEDKKNKTLKLGDGNPLEVTHGLTTIPDWGVLRFDLHAPNLASLDDTSNYLTVWIEGDDGNFVELNSQNPKAYDPTFDDSSYISNTELPAVDLRPIKIDRAKASLQIRGQTNRVGYGQYNFETFFVDIPKEFRGKSRHIKFELHGSQAVYLDDISIQSIPFKFGVLKLNGQEARDEIGTFFDQNYLSEKPQYSLSYNNQTKLANWVTWQLDSNWLSSSNKIGRPKFVEDISLPFTPQISHEDYVSPSGQNNPPIYNRGHMASAEERKRDKKDFYMTFLTSNVIPQTNRLNSGQSPWNGFEQYYINLVESEQNAPAVDIPKNELYITTGGYKDPSLPIVSTDQPIATNASIPTHIWKLILVLEEPGLTVAEIQNNPNYIDDVVAVMMPNFTPGLDIKSPQQFELPGGRIVKTQNRDDWQNWRKWTVSLDELQNATNLEFFSYLDQPTRNLIFNQAASHVQPSSPLLAESIFTSKSEVIESNVFIDSSIRSGNVVDVGIAGGQSPFIQEQFSEFSSSLEISRDQDSITKIDTSQFSMKQLSETQISPFQVGISEIDIPQSSSRQISKFQVSSFESGILTRHSSHASTSQVGLTQISPFQIGIHEIGPNQIGSSQVGIVETSFIQNRFSQISSSQISSPKVGFNQISFDQVDSFEINSREVSFPSSITSEQFLSIHNSTPQIIDNINTNALNLWNNNLNLQTPLNITFQITDLPTGQLAEAQLTQFDTQGNPIGGTISIDDDANGVGWYIDPNPQDNSEYAYTLTKNAYLATPDSPAYGKYDLLTTILHETAHLFGFIAGYKTFDNLIQTIDGIPYLIGDNFTATLDGEHLNSTAHPYDLLNTTLTPGMRKLPSELDTLILNTLAQKGQEEQGETPTAALTSAPLIALINSDFSIDEPNSPLFGWNTRGKTQIINQQAILSETSPFLSNLTQTFVVPQGAKTLQFTLVNTNLQTDNTHLAPDDAFEVALLDATTFAPIVGTASGLTHTDSLLNLQTNGTAYFSPAVTLAGTPTSGSTINLNAPRTVQIDLSTVQPGTLVTLYFDLLGFGAKDSTVTIDDVLLKTEQSQPPVAQNDSATINQNTPIIINVLENDTDTDGTINPSTLFITMAPQHGQASINPNGTVTYQPTDNYTGNDQFTYIVQDDSGIYSNPATVNISVLNPILTINQITIDSILQEGTPAQLSADATVEGNQPLTYT